MRRAYVTLSGLTAALDFPEGLGETVIAMMGLDAAVPQGSRIAAEISIEQADDGRCRVQAGSDIVAGDLAVGDAIMAAWRRAVTAIAGGFPRPSIILHTAAMARDGAGVLIPGRSGRGKSSLTAWLMAKGYQHLSDDVAAVRPDGGIETVYGPLYIRADVWPLVERLGLPGQHLDLEGGGRLLQPQAKADTPLMPLPCRLILLPAFKRKSPPAIQLLSPARAAMALMAQNHSALDTADHGLPIALAAAAGATTLKLTYGSFEEIEGVLQPLLDRILAGDAAELDAAITEANTVLKARRAASLTTTAQPATPKAPPEATPPRDIKPRLTIGMPTYDDYDGVYFSIQALRLYHAEVMSEVEFIVVDNNPTGAAAPLLKKLDTAAANYRYIPYSEKSGTANGKERIFVEASGTYVMCMDCHVFIVPGALRRLLDYFNAQPETRNLLQGPLLYDDLTSISTHWDSKWRGGMFGAWGTDDRGRNPDAEPFEIPMNGMGLFACRKDAWLHFSPDFRGFGGEEGYIHEKYRQAGHKTLCLPFLRWMHRFGRVAVPYVNTWEDRIHNYYVGHRELGLPTDGIEAHFTELLGKDVFARIVKEQGLAPAEALETA
jgi:hypothetical protein